MLPASLGSMPQKQERFPSVRFPPEVIEESLDVLRNANGEQPLTINFMQVTTGLTTWTFDSIDDFYAALRQPYDSTSIWGSHFDFFMSSIASMSIESLDRAVVQRAMAPFERDAAKYAVPPPPHAAPKPKVFIGHGRSSLWRDLKDHLSDQHGYDVEAYETGARGGHTIRDVLDSMLEVSTFAIIVMTAEDAQPDGSLRARQNVVHEAGLFQGRLGFPRTAILLEAGADPFSNLDGIQYIPFSSGNIRETYGDVLATLRREFPA